MGGNQFTLAKRLGLPIPVVSSETRKKIGSAWKGRKHSRETKEKISESRIRYLKANPDQVPYLLNHSSKQSYPEQYWATVLDANGIKYVAEYRVDLYSLDFAILDKKIDLEIDGDQHYLDPKIIRSDKRRNKFLENEGWKIIRVRWSEYTRLSNRKQFVDDIVRQLGS